jgi:hypothetical protein
MKTVDPPPLCTCHGEPMKWGKDARYRAGGQWKCRVKNRAASLAWHFANPERVRQSHLQRTFGLTIEEYDEMLTAQGGACAICKGVEKSGKRLAVDHCHETGRVRGLLCTNCNNAIGGLQDNPTLLRAAADYLEGS